MQSTNTELKQPPWLKNARGQTRRVGIELEMSGLKFDALTEWVPGFFNLSITSSGRYVRLWQNAPVGDWG